MLRAWKQPLLLRSSRQRSIERRLEIIHVQIHVDRRPVTFVSPLVVGPESGAAVGRLLEETNLRGSRSEHSNAWKRIRDFHEAKSLRIEAHAFGQARNVDATETEIMLVTLFGRPTCGHRL